MAANLFGRYVWLLDLIRHHNHITYEEIKQAWRESDLNDGEELPRRTFHNHRKAIEEIFDINIECDTRHGYRYYIEDPKQLQSNGLRGWLIDSYATLNQIQADKKLEGRIIFEEIPSGHLWLTAITNAMRRNKVLYITHKGFEKPQPKSFEIEPYCLKVVERRWYVIARNPEYSRQLQASGKEPADVFRTYALDRITQVKETDKVFELHKDFNVDRFFEGCCGVIITDDPIERVVVKAYYHAGDYLRTLPLHASQRELAHNDEYTLFEYHVKPTFDFYRLLLAQAEQVEVIEPETVRGEMRRYARILTGYYRKKR